MKHTKKAGKYNPVSTTAKDKEKTPEERRLQRNEMLKKSIWDLYVYMNNINDELAEIDRLRSRTRNGERMRIFNRIKFVRRFSNAISIPCVIFGLFLLISPAFFKGTAWLYNSFQPVYAYFNRVNHIDLVILGFGILYFIASRIFIKVLEKPFNAICKDWSTALEMERKCIEYYGKYHGFKPLNYVSSKPYILYAIYEEMDDHPEFNIEEALHSMEEKGIVRLETE